MHVLNVSMAVYTHAYFFVYCYATDVFVEVVQYAAHLSIDVGMARVMSISITNKYSGLLMLLTFARIACTRHAANNIVEDY